MDSKQPARLQLRHWFILIFCFTYFLFLNLVTYQSTGFPWGKTDHVNYLGLFNSNIDGSKLTLHYLYIQTITSISDFFALDYMFVLCAIIPLISFILFPLTLNRTFAPDKIFLIIFGTYFIWAGLSVGLMAQFVGTLFYYSRLRIISFFFHPYIVVFHTLKIIYERLPNKNLFYLFALTVLIIPRFGLFNPLPTFEPTYYFRVFRLMFPVIVYDLVMKKKNLPFLLVLLLGQNTRLAMIGIPYFLKDYAIPKNKIFWVFILIYFFDIFGLQSKEVWMMHNDPCHPYYMGLNDCLTRCHPIFNTLKECLGK